MALGDNYEPFKNCYMYEEGLVVYIYEMLVAFDIGLVPFHSHSHLKNSLKLSRNFDLFPFQQSSHTTI